MKSIKELINKPIPNLNLELESLCHNQYVELWISDSEVVHHTTDEFDYSFDGNNLFGTYTFTEADSVNNIYTKIFEITKNTNYPYINRIWNYIPDINTKNKNGIDNYKAFCNGRWESFNNHYSYQYPAGTGIGNQSKETSIYFISSSLNNGIYIENPVQIPAYKYNKTKSPCFSRGCYNHLNDILYISGTASIIKNESTGINDIKTQCLTTLDNISTLISRKNLLCYNLNKNYDLQDIDCIKIYIKNNEDYSLIHEICSKTFSPNTSIAYLKADICRNELLLEIEGLIQHNSNNVFS